MLELGLWGIPLFLYLIGKSHPSRDWFLAAAWTSGGITIGEIYILITEYITRASV